MSPISRKLAHSGFQHKGENETHHMFKHFKSGNEVHVDKKERVGGHAWEYKVGGKSVAKGIGHHNFEHQRLHGPIKEDILPGFLNFVSLNEKEIKLKAKVKVKIEVPDGSKAEVKEAYVYQALKDMPGRNHTTHQNIQVKSGDKLKYRSSVNGSHYFSTPNSHEISISVKDAPSHHFKKIG